MPQCAMTKTVKTKLRAKLQKTYRRTSLEARRVMAMLEAALSYYENYDVVEVDIEYLDSAGNIDRDMDNSDVTLAVIGYTNAQNFKVLGYVNLWAMKHPLTADIG